MFVGISYFLSLHQKCRALKIKMKCFTHTFRFQNHLNSWTTWTEYKNSLVSRRGQKPQAVHVKTGPYLTICLECTNTCKWRNKKTLKSHNAVGLLYQYFCSNNQMQKPQLSCIVLLIDKACVLLCSYFVLCRSHAKDNRNMEQQRPWALEAIVYCGSSHVCEY